MNAHVGRGEESDLPRAKVGRCLEGNKLVHVLLAPLLLINLVQERLNGRHHPLCSLKVDMACGRVLHDSLDEKLVLDDSRRWQDKIIAQAEMKLTRTR